MDLDKFTQSHHRVEVESSWTESSWWNLNIRPKSNQCQHDTQNSIEAVDVCFYSYNLHNGSSCLNVYNVYKYIDSVYIETKWW